jgi:hypothetical protein
MQDSIEGTRAWVAQFERAQLLAEQAEHLVDQLGAEMWRSQGRDRWRRLRHVMGHAKRRADRRMATLADAWA